jgi:chromatin remodeling complex protein RSC6
MAAAGLLPVPAVSTATQRRQHRREARPLPVDQVAQMAGAPSRYLKTLPAKSQRSQTEVTKFISTYVKTHNCFDPNFKRRILPNAALAKLLKVDDKTEVTYLNLQKYLKVHFLKATTA